MDRTCCHLPARHPGASLCSGRTRRNRSQELASSPNVGDQSWPGRCTQHSNGNPDPMASSLSRPIDTAHRATVLGDAPALVLGRRHPGDHAFVTIDDDICCWNLQLQNLPQTGGFPESFEVNDDKTEQHVLHRIACIAQFVPAGRKRWFLYGYCCFWSGLYMISHISKSLPLSYSLMYWGISAGSICFPTKPGPYPLIWSLCPAIIIRMKGKYLDQLTVIVL